MTSLPPPDEPDIYESLINALIAASSGFREASTHFEAALPHMRRALELDRQILDIIEESGSVSADTTSRLLEAVRLVQDDPRRNVTEALAMTAHVTAELRRARSITAQSAVLNAHASVEMVRGLETWHQGSESLRTGLERATTLLQAARRPPTNGGNPDTTVA